MITGAIRRVLRARVERRDDARLPAVWVSDETAAPAAPGPSTSWLQRVEDAAGTASIPAGPVLAMLAGAGSAALGELLAHATNGQRVYVLSSTTWDPRVAHPRLASCPRVLLRRVPQLPASAVVTPRGGRLWFGGRAGDAEGWTLRLDDDQTAALRWLFLRMFWHDAVDETWTDDDQRPPFVPARRRPFEIDELPSAAPIRLTPANAPLDLELQDAVVHSRHGVLPTRGTIRRLWVPPSDRHHEVLAQLVRNGVEVRWTERGLPDAVIGVDRGALLLASAGDRMRITLTAAQAAEAAQLLDGPGAWRFQVDARLAELAQRGCRVQLSGALGASPVEAEQRLDLGEIQAAHLASVDGAVPDRWPAPSPLALTVRYLWTVVPPRVPPHADEAPLVATWRALDQAWSARLAKLRSAVEEVRDHRVRLAGSSPRLAGPLLGFERDEATLRDRLTALDGQLPSQAGAADARRRLGELDGLEQDVRRLADELTKADQDAQDAAAREAQETAWRQKVELARQGLTERRAALDAATQRRSTLLDAQQRNTDELRTADKHARKDLQAAAAKLRDERERSEASIRKIQAEIDSLTRDVDAPFTFQPVKARTASPGSTKARFVPPPSARASASTVPDESMPEVGRLRTAQGQRYLVIDTWEELERGQQAADRLGAHLVAPEDT